MSNNSYSLLKKLNKNELWDKCNQFYNNRNLNDLVVACSLYLTYFSDFDDNEVHTVRFYRAFANFSIDTKAAISDFEELICNKNVKEDIKNFSKWNLEKLYPKNKDPIPKIIHLIYFKERDLQNYHYECIISMIDNMPEYEIIIYNDIEPVDNKYWNLLKNNNRIKIKHTERPRQFDGFDLKYVQYAADVTRLEMLYEHGGIYLDFDLLVIKNFEQIINSGEEFYISREGKGERLINCFLAAKPKNEFLRIWLDSFKTGLRMSNWAYHISTSNLKLLENNPHYYLKYHIKILDHEHFLPFSWTERHKFIDIEKYLNKDKTFGIHLFDTILHNALLDNKYFKKEIPKLSDNILTNDENKQELINDDMIEKKTLLENKKTDTPNHQIEPGKILTLKSNENAKKHILNDFVNEIVVLSLENYPDRLIYMESELKKYNIAATFHINKPHKYPVTGCFGSHINAIKYAKEHDLEKILILEDDIIIRDNFDCLNDLPNDWDMIYLGGILTKQTELKEKWVRGTIWCNHAYIVKKNMYDVILQKYSEFGPEEIISNKYSTDWFYTKFFNTTYKCWLAIDQPIIQKEGYSIIDNKNKWGKDFNWDTFTMKYI